MRRCAGERRAIEPVEQCRQAGDVAIHAPQQPVQRGIIQHQPASLRPLAQHSRRPSSSSGSSVMRVHWPSRNAGPATTTPGHPASPARVQHRDAVAAGAIVEVEQCDLVVAQASDGVQAV
jgi:hypothetical protein